ncbi:MAG: hypothetical protein AAB451_01680 [Patescibacteria group bacterium]
MKKFSIFSILTIILVLLSALWPANVAAAGEGTFQILSPNGGEYRPGEDIFINWFHPLAVAGKTVKLNISLLRDDEVGEGWKTVQNIINNIEVSVYSPGPSKGEWSWRIPESFIPGKYMVYIAEWDGKITYSDISPFNIPILATGNPLITFGTPDIKVMPDIQATLLGEYFWKNFRVYNFILKNNSLEPGYILSGFGNNMASWYGDYDPVEYQWWTNFSSNGKIVSLDSQRLELEPGEEYTLSLTLQILHVRGKATVYPYLTQIPRLHDVKFSMSNGVVNVNWKSTGNIDNEPVRIITRWLNESGKTIIADIPDNGILNWYVETFPKGEYYMTIFFLSSSGIQEIHSPLYASPGP